MSRKRIKLKAREARPDHIKELVDDLKVIYTDIDSTLLGPAGCLFLTADSQYTIEPAKALITALRAGIDVVPVSGRTRKQLFSDARLLGLSNYIAELGCQIVYDQGRKVIYNYGDSTLRIGDGTTLLDELERLGVDKLLFEHFQGRLEHHTPWSQERECTYVFRGLIDVHQANDFLTSQGFPDLQVVDNGRIHAVPGELSTALPELRAYHLLPKGLSKAGGVRQDRQLRGFSHRQCIAIGDAFSDLEIAPEVGALFLVDDADAFQAEHPGKRDHDNAFVTRKKMGEGWAEVISLFLELE